MESINKHDIVCIGGGTGLSTMLRGLKEYTDQLTAIVTVADNGGSSGILRREMNMLPPGDIRNCLLALAETEPILDQVFRHRFKEGSLKGQNLGNLFLAALTEIYDSFELAVEKATEILAVKGTVLPVTTENVQLCATYEDDTQIIGETQIVEFNKSERKHIHSIRLLPERPHAYEKAVEAILQADIILLGPGSLYTSIIPNLLVKGIPEAIRQSHAKIIYVSNMMTQPGETDGYSLRDHLEAIETHLGKGVIHKIIVNSKEIPQEIMNNYLEDGCQQVAVDLSYEADGIKIIESPLVYISHENKYVRHDPDLLARLIMTF